MLKNGLIHSPLCRDKLNKGEDKDQVHLVTLQIKDQLLNSQETCLWPKEKGETDGVNAYFMPQKSYKQKIVLSVHCTFFAVLWIVSAVG